jgi:methylmalonyl-CoA mutase N-terminal domain/subunit
MSNEKIKAELEKYEAAVAKAIEKTPERKHLPEQRLYTPLDVKGVEAYTDEIGFPGQYPFTRGVQPTMYRGRFWTMRMYAGFSTAKASNERYRYLIANGGTGLSCAFDLPTQIGYDSDDPISEGEVGKVGVAIDSLADMEVLFDQIDLGKVSTSMTINAPASVLLAMYIAVAEEQGVPADQLRGTIQNDILKEYAARGTYIFPPKPSMRIITNIFEFARRTFRSGIRFRFPVTISARPVPPLRRKSRSRSPMVSLTLMPPSRPAWTSTISRAVCPSSGTRITTFSKRLRSSALPAASGRRS